MLGLCCMRGLAVAARGPITSKAARQAIQSISKRTFISITPLRPTLTNFRPSTLTQIPEQSATTDIVPKTSISAHPAFAGIGIQIRCGPRNTFDASHFVRKRRHGFLSRIRTRKGRALLKRRKAKGRSTLSH